ncbi:MAG: ABC transporter permease, partial [Balneolales bacterium]|nr:ABC transporter permease [Balneolales bacterium]
MESFLITLLSSILAIGLMEFLLLGFNQVTGKSLQIDLLGNPELLLGLIGIALTSSFLAGVYPALYLSQFKPVNILKGQFKTGKAAVIFRKGLVTLQFVITIGLIICTIIVTKQFNFLQDRGLGINAEALVSIPVKNDIQDNYQSFKQELLSQPDVSMVTTGPLFLGGIYFETFSEDSDVDHRPKNNTLQLFYTDYDFVSTLDLELLAGRDFSRDISTDFENAILINETAIDEFGWVNPSDALGKELDYGDKTYTIVGVVQDFHTFSPKSSLLPVAVHLTDKGFSQVLVKLDTQNLSGTVESLKSVWAEFEPFLPFELNFMDQEIAAEYLEERNLFKLFSSFAMLAIMIACLGLFG